MAAKKRRKKAKTTAAKPVVHHKKTRRKKASSKIASITKYKTERGIAVKARLQGVVKDLDRSQRVIEDALLGM